MTKHVLIFLLLLGSSFIQAQTITYEDFKSLLPDLQEENWKGAFKKSSKLLSNAIADTSEFKAIVIYINIFSAAGMVSEGKMSYKKLKKHVVQYEGQKILMSAHPIASSENNTLRKTHFSETDSTYQAFTSATNSEETSIFCFEQFYFNEKVNVAAFGKSFVRLGGTLEKIEFNPNESTLWIMRLTIRDSFARKAN